MDTVLTSKNNVTIKYLKKLFTSNSFRNEEKKFILYDLDLIKIAKKKDLIVKMFSTSKLKGFEDVTLISKEMINYILNGKNSDYIAVVNFIESFNDFSNKIIYLDEVKDPTNLAKIIYLMNLYGFKDLILSPNCVSLYNEKCLSHLKQELFLINYHYGDIKTLLNLKKRGYSIYSTGLNSNTFLKDSKLANSSVIVLGNEARGVSKEILEISNFIIKIPIKNVDSFNVSVAFSILIDNLK